MEHHAYRISNPKKPNISDPCELCGLGFTNSIHGPADTIPVISIDDLLLSLFKYLQSLDPGAMPSDELRELVEAFNAYREHNPDAIKVKL